MAGEPLTELNDTRRDLLYLMASNDAATGQELSRQLSEAEGEEVNNGRLYPAIDDLVEADLIQRVEVNDRSNAYGITHKGRKALESDLQWRQSQLEDSPFFD